MNPDISVLMPAHNAERYIGDAVRSVLGENRLNIELVIVNDRSSDSTEQIIRQFAEQDPRVTIVNRTDRLEDESPEENRWYMEHLGHAPLPEALNLGLRFCRGRYIARLDADDIAINDRFLVQFNFLETHPDISFIGSSAIRIDENGREFGRYHNKPMSHQEIVSNIRTFSPFCPHPSWFVRKEVYDALNGYDRGGYRAEDLDFMLRVSEHDEFRFAFITQPLIKLRMHGGSLSYTSSAKPVAYAIAATVRHKLRMSGKSQAEIEKIRFKILNMSESQIRQQKLDRKIEAYNLLRFSYIALKTGKPLEGAKLALVAFVKSPKIVFDYKAIRFEKSRAADMVISNLCRA